MVRVHAATTPDAPAYILGDRTVTYAELDERSNRVAQGLRAAGVGAGDRVAILDKNCLEYFEVLFGAAKLNAVLVAVNWRLAPPEAAFIVNDAAAKVLVVGEELVPLLDGFEADLAPPSTILVIGDHDRHQSYEAWVDAHDAVDPGVVAGPDDVAFQYYSSGTTGLPKGVMLTNGACFAGARGVEDLLGFDDTSVSMAVMPQFHVAGGFWGLVRARTPGGPRCCSARSTRRDRRPDRASTASPTRCTCPRCCRCSCMVPGIADADLSSLRCIVYGASPISEEVLVASIRTFGCDFLQAYGMTETSGGCVFLPPEDHDPDGPNRHRLRAAGIAAPGTELKVVDAELEPVPTGDGRRDPDPQRRRTWRLLEPARGDRRHDPPGRLAAHRRRRLPRRGRLPLHPRPREGHDHLGRRERVPGRGGEPADGPPRGRRRRRHRRARRQVGRDAEGARRARARRRAHRDRTSSRSPARASPTTSARPRSSGATSCPATPAASS